MPWIVYLIIFIAILVGLGVAGQYFGIGRGLIEIGAGIGTLGAGIGAFGRGIGTAIGGFISEAFSPKIKPEVTPTFLPTVGFKLCFEPFLACSSPSGISGGYNSVQGVYESLFKTDSKYVPKMILTPGAVVPSTLKQYVPEFLRYVPSGFIPKPQ